MTPVRHSGPPWPRAQARDKTFDFGYHEQTRLERLEDASMNDRSVQAGTISQSNIVTGDNNSLYFGDAGISVPLKRKHFRPPERRRRPASDERPRELDLLAPEAGKLPLVGRKDLLAELRTWLDDEADVSVHALIGRAGTGKTRLALELCGAIDRDPAGKGVWIAGFVSPSDLSRFVDIVATHSFDWERPTLLVIDYAAQVHSALVHWLDRLAFQKLKTKLRILLLDREAPEGFGWWHELTSPTLRDEQTRLDLFHTLRPRHLPDLSALEERRDLMTAAYKAACDLRPPPSSVPSIPAEGEDADFDARLADRQFGNPLSLVMAGVIAHDRDPRAALALRRLDAAWEFGGRELDRLANLAESRGLDRDTMRYIVAFNGLAGGLPLDGLRKTLSDELLASQRMANTDVLSELLEQELPSRIETTTPVQERHLTTIQPDLVGEAATIRAFTGQPSREAEAPAAVRRAFALGRGKAAQAFVQLIQDFGYAVEDKSTTENEKETGRRVMDWLRALASNIKDPVLMIPLVEALPLETTILRETAAELTKHISTFFGEEAQRSNDPVIMSKAAGWTNNLANRLSDLGRRDEALAAAVKALGLYSALAEAHPDIYTPDLALSLNTLAISLSQLGRRDEALPAAEEAVHLNLALAEAGPGAFTQHYLARSLSSLSTCLSNLGRLEQALFPAQEAVRLHRTLTDAFPRAFTPDLAKSLNNLALVLGPLNKGNDALAAAEEAVRLYRGLAEARPDAFTPDLAMSLQNLTIVQNVLGKPEKALPTGEEAVSLYRALAEIRPDAFRQNLAASLNSLANRLRALGRRKEALAAAEETVHLPCVVSWCTITEGTLPHSSALRRCLRNSRDEMRHSQGPRLIPEREGQARDKAAKAFP
jgi:tetratricopeptide (TPR) repeat protein